MTAEPGETREDDDGIWCGNPRECANGPADHPWHISCLVTPERAASIRAWLEEQPLTRKDRAKPSGPA